MRKLLVIIVVLLIVASIVAGYISWHSRTASARKAELRAYMQDEDADRPSEPAVALKVNNAEQPVLVTSAPALFTIGVTNPRAAERAASVEVLEEKIKKLSALPQTPDIAKRLKIAQDNYQKKVHAPSLTLGDTSHAWTEALQISLRTGSADAPLPFPIQPVHPVAAKSVTLGPSNAVEITYGNASNSFAPGNYTLVTCLGATGTWKGKSCSEPVQITVVGNAADLSPDQQDAFTRHTARYALLTGDWPKLEQIGKAISARDPVAGHIYVGEAKYGQKAWKESLAQFIQARRILDRQNPDKAQPGRYLDMRISQVIGKMYKE